MEKCLGEDYNRETQQALPQPNDSENYSNVCS
jgi:hypothetical protein